MADIALTRASELIQVAETLEQLGESPERIMAQANLPMWQYCDPNDLIPKHHIFELMDRAARSLGSPIFGLHVGEQTSLSTMGSLGKLVASSVSVYDAMTTGCRLIHLHNAGSHLSLVEAGDEAWFCHSEFHVPRNGRWQKELFTLMRGIDGVRMGAGPSWRPAKICLQTHEAPGRDLREALGDPEIRLGQQTTAIAIPRALLAQPLRRNGSSGEAIEVLEGRLRDMAPSADFADTLRKLAGTLLKTEGVLRIETMAEITGLSVRTLQRRLAKHGLTHFKIIDQARYQTAARLLGDADIRITDVAMDLGYADSAHFTRAFKRWAGMTPREYRSHELML